MEFLSSNQKRTLRLPFKAILWITFTLFYLPAYALPVPTFNLYGGAGLTKMDASTVSIFPDEIDTLKDNHHPIDFTGGIGIAYPISNLPNSTIGLDMFFMNMQGKGRVYQYGLSNADNYRYRLKFKTVRYMLDGTIGLGELKYHLIPFIKASIGMVNVNTRYRETPNSSAINGGMLNLPQHTDNHLAYSAGFGLKKQLSTQFLLSALYLYTDMGTAESATQNIGNDVVLNKPIKTNLYTHSLMIELSLLLA